MRLPWRKPRPQKAPRCDHEEIARLFECVATLDGEKVPFGRGIRIQASTRMGEPVVEVVFHGRYVTGTLTATDTYFGGKWIADAICPESTTVVDGDLTIFQALTFTR